MNNPTTIIPTAGWANLLVLLASAGAVAQSVNTDSNGIEVEASDLSRRLIEGNTRGADDADVMVRTLQQMDAAQQRLHRKFDAGETTQQMQRGVLELLDEAINLALQQRRDGGGAAQSGDQRRMPPGDGQKQKPSSTAAATGQDAGRRGAVSDERAATAGGTLDESQRTWGHLPPRDREAIVQSMGESVLEQYRSLIEAYYASLAKPEEPADD